MRTLLLLALLLSGCQRKLDPETAKRLIVEKLFTPPKGQCNWQGVERITDKDYIFHPNDGLSAACASALAQAGLVKIGGCIDPFPGGCYRALITAAGTAWLHDDFWLSFYCQSVTLPEIKSITTDGSKAVVTYERTGSPDDGLLGKLDVCKLEKPVMGRLERTKHFSRDDAGRWHLEDK